MTVSAQAGPAADNAPLSREELLEVLLMDHGDAVCALDLKDTILYVNQAAAQLLGGTVESLVGRAQQEVFGDRVYAETQKQLDERLQGRSSTYELGMYDPAGRERTLLVTGCPLRNRAGAIVGSYGVLKDITERKRREQALETRLMLEAAVADSVRALTRVGRFEEALDQALGVLGILLNAQCVRLYLERDARELVCAREWPPALPAERSVLERPFALARYPWWMAQLRAGHCIHLKSRADLPVEAVEEARTMQLLDITSILALPLLDESHLRGFVSFENPDPWGDVLQADLGSLLVFADVLTALMRRPDPPEPAS